MGFAEELITEEGRRIKDEPGHLNPYQEVMKILTNTLEDFDDDHLIPSYGFGDEVTKVIICSSVSVPVEIVGASRTASPSSPSLLYSLSIEAPSTFPMS